MYMYIFIVGPNTTTSNEFINGILYHFLPHTRKVCEHFCHLSQLFTCLIAAVCYFPFRLLSYLIFILYFCLLAIYINCILSIIQFSLPSTATKSFPLSYLLSLSVALLFLYFACWHAHDYNCRIAQDIWLIHNYTSMHLNWFIYIFQWFGQFH